MTALVERLDWDSDFFGVPIGRADLTGLDAAGLAEVLGVASDLGIACLYGFVHPTSDVSGGLEPGSTFRLVDVRCTMTRPLTPPSADPTGKTVRLGDERDLAAVDRYLDDLTPWSRFAADPRFGLAPARRMYEVWMRRAATEDGHALVVSGDGELSGFITASVGEVREIGIMAVAEPGAGVGAALVEAASAWAGGGPLRTSIAVRNTASLRLFMKLGFRIEGSQFVYHAWLDDDAVAT